MRHWHVTAAVVLCAAAGVLLTSCAGGGRGFNLQNVDVGQLVQNVKGVTHEVTQPEEIEIGDGVTETLLGARPLENDVELQRYVNVVGVWVAQQSERRDLPWHFGVNDSDTINAFAAPGGNVIVTKGMIRVLRNESELAGVLGHEIGHVVRKHHLNAIRKNAMFGLVAQGLQVASQGSHNESLVGALIGPTKDLYAKGLDKSDEFEADRIGVVLASRAGYDPWGLPSALQTLGSVNPGDNAVKLLFKTHPAPSARLEKLAVVMGATFDNMAGGPAGSDRFDRATQRVRVVATK